MKMMSMYFLFRFTATELMSSAKVKILLVGLKITRVEVLAKVDYRCIDAQGLPNDTEIAEKFAASMGNSGKRLRRMLVILNIITLRRKTNWLLTVS